MKYHLGPLIGKGTVLDSFRGPDKTNGMVLLGDNLAFIWCDDGVDLGPDYTIFGKGDIRSISPDSTTRAKFASALGIIDVTGTTLADWLYSAMTIHAFEGGRKPLLPSKDLPNLPGLTIPLILQGHGVIKSIPLSFSTPEGQAVKAQYQDDYRAYDTLDKQGEITADIKLKVLGGWQERFNLSTKDTKDFFIPVDLPQQDPIKPTTTLQDDFNRADANSLGTSTGPNSGWAWNTYDTQGGTGLILNTTRFGITSNQAVTKSGQVNSWYLSRADSDLSSADHSAQVTIAVWGSTAQAGPRVRCALTTDGTSYFSRALLITGNTTFSKFDSNGGITDIVTVSQTVAVGKVLKITINGSAYAVNYDGSDIITGTDSSISAGVRAGIFSYDAVGGNTGVDNFSASDVGGGATNTDRTPSVGALALTGVAGRNDKGQIGTVGSCAFTGVAPSLVIGTVLTPTVGALALTGIASRMDLGLISSVGSLLLTGQQPTVTNSGDTAVNITPTVGALTLTGVAGRLDLGLISTAGSLVLTGKNAQIDGALSITPTVGTLAFTGIAGRNDRGLIETVGACVITGIAPSVVQGKLITPTVGALAASGVAGRLDLGLISTVGSLVLTGGLASIASVNASITPSVGSLTLSGVAPSIQSTLSVAPGAGALALAGVAGRLNLGLTPQTGQLVFVSLEVVNSSRTPAVGSLAFTGKIGEPVVFRTAESNSLFILDNRSDVFVLSDR